MLRSHFISIFFAASSASYGCYRSHLAEDAGRVDAGFDVSFDTMLDTSIDVPDVGFDVLLDSPGPDRFVPEDAGVCPASPVSAVTCDHYTPNGTPALLGGLPPRGSIYRGGAGWRMRYAVYDDGGRPEEMYVAELTRNIDGVTSVHRIDDFPLVVDGVPYNNFEFRLPYVGSCDRWLLVVNNLGDTRFLVTHDSRGARVHGPVSIPRHGSLSVGVDGDHFVLLDLEIDVERCATRLHRHRVSLDLEVEALGVVEIAGGLMLPVWRPEERVWVSRHTRCGEDALGYVTIDDEGRVVGSGDVYDTRGNVEGPYLHFSARGPGLGLWFREGRRSLYAVPFDVTTGVVDPPVKIFEASPGYTMTEPGQQDAQALGDGGFVVAFVETRDFLQNLWGLRLMRDGTTAQRVLIASRTTVTAPFVDVHWLGEDGLAVSWFRARERVIDRWACD